MFVKLCTVRRVYTYEIYHYTVYYSIGRVCIQVISIGNSMLKTDFHFIHSFILEFDSLHGMPIHNAYTEYTHPFVNKTISRIHALVNTSSPYMDVTHTHTLTRHSTMNRNSVGMIGAPQWKWKPLTRNGHHLWWVHSFSALLWTTTKNVNENWKWNSAQCTGWLQKLSTTKHLYINGMPFDALMCV